MFLFWEIQTSLVLASCLVLFVFCGSVHCSRGLHKLQFVATIPRFVKVKMSSDPKPSGSPNSGAKTTNSVISVLVAKNNF